MEQEVPPGLAGRRTWLENEGGEGGKIEEEVVREAATGDEGRRGIGEVE